MNSSVLLPVLIVFIAFFFFWTWRGNRKRRRDEEAKSAQLVKGVEVMTNFGLFGTVESIDLETNKVVLETGPGTFVTVHRQAIGRIETPAGSTPDADAASDSTVGSASTGDAPVDASSSAIAAANAAAKAQAAGAADKPKFGERKSDA